MAEQQSVKVTPKELKNSQAMWDNFVVGSKYTIYAIVALLIFLAAAFVQF